MAVKKKGLPLNCGMSIAECGLKKFLKNPKSEISGPMLFPRNPAKGGTSGFQACFFAERQSSS